MRRVVITAFLGMHLASCAGSPPPEPVGPPRLAFTGPRDSTAVFVVADTATVSVDMAGQTIPVRAASRAEMVFDFSPLPRGVRATVTFREYDATLENPLQGATTATEEQIDGPLVMTLNNRAIATVESTPDLSGPAAQFLRVGQLAATLFPRLPGVTVTAGDAWTDTIDVRSVETEALRVDARTVLRYVTVGDTLVGGTPLVLVRFRGDTEQTLEGTQAGFELTQTASGPTQGHFLWDLQAGLLHASESVSDLVGTMEVSAAPFPLSVRIESTSRTARLER